VTVCSIDPFCCDINWDQICIDESCDLCQFVDCCITACGIGFPPACGPGAGDCFVADGTPGCDDCECCALVCGADPFCCDAAWDGVCAGQAGLVCVSDCFQIISESTECIGASGDFNYQVTGSNACTNSTISFDFMGSGGEPGEPMCFDLSLFDNNGDLCCNATVCPTVPDCLPSSQPCDLDGDQAIGVSDLLILLAAWSSSPRGPPDYDGDGTVAITDFLYLLSNWGSCQ
jgi:hypothetical protein